MEITYLYPFWGSEAYPIGETISTILDNGFHGIEINYPEDQSIIKEIQSIQKEDFIVVGQQVLSHRNESPVEYLNRALSRLETIAKYQPDCINSHTGKDHFTFEENCFIIEGIENWSDKNGIEVMHEIHRGRFSFHPALIQLYIERFPSLKLVGDFSHWCVVSESLLEHQEQNIDDVIPYISHIHARIGWSQSAQVNDPFAPEWKHELHLFTKWWQKIIDYQKNKSKHITITTEFGPYPYLSETPYERKPLANQMEVNLKMKSHLVKHLTL